MPPDVLVVGEALVDVMVAPDGTRTERPGGSPANVAVGLARLGHHVTLLTALGDDEHGRLIRRHLDSSGVEVIASPIARTSTATATIDREGKASYVFEIDWKLDDLPEPRDAWLHIGSLGSVLPPGADAVLELARAAARLSFDPNCRPSFTDLTRVDELIRLSHTVKLSDEDVASLRPDQPAGEVAAGWLRSGPELVVLTKGADGATAFTREGVVEAPAADGAAVVDTVGAGDAFMAGLLDGLLRSLPLPEVLARAATTARRTCERVGADPPWAREL